MNMNTKSDHIPCRAAKKRLLAALALLVLSLLCGCQAQPAFVGSSVENADEYLLTFETLDTVRSANMTLRENDSIRVTIDAAGGRLNLLVYPAGRMDEPIYRADDADSGEFLLTIGEDGEYTFRVEGKGAKGAVHFALEH